MIVQCVICGSDYKRKPCHAQKIFTCGNKACTSKYLKSVPNSGRFKSQNNRITKTCAYCKKSFTPYNSLLRKGYGKFCSHNCYSLSMTKLDSIEKIIRKRLDFRIRWALKRGRSRKKHTLVELIGCDLNTFKKHLEGKFAEGMSWKNYGQWHIDHITPVSSFDLTSPQEQLRAFHYKNTQPLWAVDNIRKGAKITQPLANLGEDLIARGL